MKKIFAVTIVALLLTGIVCFLPVASGTANAATFAPHSAAKSSQVTQGDCGNHTDFWKMWYEEGGTTCFANAGTWEEPEHYIIRLCSGNNRGTAKIAQYDSKGNPVVFTDTFNRNQCRNYNNGTVEQFTIF